MNAAARPALAAQTREQTGKKVARLRLAGRLPAVVYGHGFASQSISVDTHEFELFRKHSGPNTLLDLVLDGGKATPSLVQSVQVHPVSRRPLHVDLFAVRMTEELTVDVPLVPTGSTKLVDNENGTLSHSDSVRVRALPDHLPQSIDLPIDGLTSFEMTIHARDLVIPGDAHLVTDPDEVVARILPPRVEEAAAATAEAGAAEGEAAADSGDSGSADAAAES